MSSSCTFIARGIGCLLWIFLWDQLTVISSNSLSQQYLLCLANGLRFLLLLACAKFFVLHEKNSRVLVHTRKIIFMLFTVWHSTG